MSGFVQTLAGGVVGAGAVLAAVYLPGALRPEAPAVTPGPPRPHRCPRPAPALPVAAGDAFGPGAVVLAQSAEACPEGWAPRGRVALLASPQYELAEGQQRSNPGVMTTATMGFASVPFALCVKEAAP